MAPYAVFHCTGGERVKPPKSTVKVDGNYVCIKYDTSNKPLRFEFFRTGNEKGRLLIRSRKYRTEIRFRNYSDLKGELHEFFQRTHYRQWYDTHTVLGYLITQFERANTEEQKSQQSTIKTEAATQGPAFRYLEEYGIPERPDWLIPGVVPKKGITIVAGAPGCMKSLIMQETASALTNNRPVFGEFTPTRRGKVILVDGENSHSIIYDRLKRIGMPPEKTLIVHNFRSFFDLLNEEHANTLMGEVKTHKPALIIFDTLRRCFSGNENDSSLINEIYQQTLSAIAEKCAVLLVVHTRKMGRGFGVMDKLSEIRGTGDIPGIAAAVHMVNKTQDGMVVVEPLKIRQAKDPQPFTIQLNDDEENDSLSFSYEGTREKFLSVLTRGRDELFGWLQKNATAGQELAAKELKGVYANMGYGGRGFYEAIGGLMNLGVLKRVARGKYELAHKKK